MGFLIGFLVAPYINLATTVDDTKQIWEQIESLRHLGTKSKLRAFKGMAP